MSPLQDTAGCPEVLRSIDAPDRYGDFSCGERHGSYEKTWSWKNDKLTCFVVAALTPCEGSNRVEVWFGADDGRRFVRKLSKQYLVNDPEKPEEELKEKLIGAVGRAAEEASLLTEGDLRETRIVTPAISALESRQEPR